jgi:hypothetical protein
MPRPSPRLPTEPPSSRHPTARRAYSLNGVHIRELALAAGYPSDEVLARAAGVSYGYLWQCLTGRRAAGPKVVAGLLRALPAASLNDLVAPPERSAAAVSA